MNKKHLTIYDRNLKITKSETNFSTFAYLFSEIIQYHQSRQRNIEDELEKMGFNIGIRLLELLTIREKTFKRELEHIEMLKFISQNVR